MPSVAAVVVSYFVAVPSPGLGSLSLRGMAISSREGVQAMGAKRVVIVVKPEKILSWDHSKLGGAY